MTNKPIIVDGVDVSGCDFLAKEDDYCSYSGEYRAYKGQCGCSDEEMCKDHPNCFYKKALKQLQRKEKKCEELKEEINLLRQYKGSKQASYESMQAEWNNAVSQNRDLLKQVEKWQEKYNKLEAEVERLRK